MILKLEGREKVVWKTVADKVNEIIEVINNLEILLQENKLKEDKQK